MLQGLDRTLDRAISTETLITRLFWTDLSVNLFSTFAKNKLTTVVVKKRYI